MGILTAATLIGGTVLGAVAARSLREGWVQMPEIPEEQSPAQELLQFGIANGAMVMGMIPIRQVIIDMGRDKFLALMAAYGGALVLARLAVLGYRKARGED